MSELSNDIKRRPNGYCNQKLWPKAFLDKIEDFPKFQNFSKIEIFTSRRGSSKPSRPLARPVITGTRPTITKKAGEAPSYDVGAVLDLCYFTYRYRGPRLVGVFQPVLSRIKSVWSKNLLSPFRDLDLKVVSRDFRLLPHRLRKN